MSENKVVHVVAGVIYDKEGHILIAHRHDGQHQGGKWEFPGGKCEANEEPLAALQRELHEELDIDVQQASPLIKIRHDYPDKSILLDVWEVSEFSGEAHGKEGQPIKWVTVNELDEHEFPEANLPIITAIKLPKVCQITPDPTKCTNFMLELENTLKTGIKLVQFRPKRLSNSDYLAMARDVIKLAHEYDAKVMLNSPPIWLHEADGMHLSSLQLLNTPFRPSVGSGKWVSASCHTPEELAHAAYIKADFALLSPVKETKSHPGVKGIGWAAFADVLQDVKMPVYALGGMKPEDMADAHQHGAQGIAAISGFWQAL